MQNDNSNGYRNLLSKVSQGFAKRGRVTFLIFVGIILLGGISYTTLLQRDGFPEVSFPGGVVTVRYFEEDLQKVDAEVTTPIEVALADITEITQIDSTTTESGSFFFIQFQEQLTSDEGMKIVKDALNDEVNLPETAGIEFQNIKASSVDGENDLLFTISSDEYSTLEKQEKAAEIAARLTELPEVLISQPVDQITTEIDSAGEEFEFKSTFQRVATRQNGELKFENAVAIGVVKSSSDIGTLEISEAVREEIENLEEEGILDGYEVAYGGDFADSLNGQIASLENNAIAGLLTVIIILLVFVSWRASIITAIFIPAVMASVFATFFVLGYTLNIISLFALILVLGLLVDDAIVVVESIEKKRRAGQGKIESIKNAIYEIGPADVSGSLTTLLVFMPMLFISGILGKFIIQIPITVIMTLVYSVTIALTIIPFLSILFLSGKKEKGDESQAEKIIDSIFYGPSRFVVNLGNKIGDFVYFYLGKKLITFVMIVLGLGLIFFGLSFTSRLKFDIFPSVKDSDELNIAINQFPGKTVDEAEEISIEVENLVLDAVGEENIAEATYFYGDRNQTYIAFDLIPMSDRDVKSSELVDKLETEFLNFEKAQVKATSGSVGPPSEDYQFFVQIYGENQEAIEQLSADVDSFVKSVVLEDGVKATDTLITGLNVITKKDGIRYIEFKSKLSDTTNTAYVLELTEKVKDEFDAEKLAEYGLTDDSLGFDLGQESENLESFNQTIFAFGFAMILMYGLLVLQFNSFTQPALVMFAIPLSFPGLFPGLYITDNPLSFFVMIGIIGLAGIVVNNTIMLVDFANQYRSEGKEIRESISQAVRDRFRALLATTGTTVGGLLPLALQDPFWESLAFSIVFGLLSSLVLVILIFPAYFSVVEKTRTAFNRFVVNKLGLFRD